MTTQNINKVLVAVGVGIWLIVLLKLFTEITEAIITILGTIAALAISLFPSLTKFHEKLWFSNPIITVVLAIICCAGAFNAYSLFIPPTSDATSISLTTANSVALATATAIENTAFLQDETEQVDIIFNSRQVNSHTLISNSENFIFSGKFHNPSLKFGWSYSIRFREIGSQYYELAVAKGLGWQLIIFNNGKSEQIAVADVEEIGLNIAEGGYNNLKLVVRGNKAIVIFNEDYARIVDLPDYSGQGKIRVMAWTIESVENKALRIEKMKLKAISE